MSPSFDRPEVPLSEVQRDVLMRIIRDYVVPGIIKECEKKFEESIKSKFLDLSCDIQSLKMSVKDIQQGIGRELVNYALREGR